MIDEDETFRRFGYHVYDLKPGSHKKVWCICELCGKGREKERRDAHQKCRDCALSKIGGKNNPNWGGGELGKVCAWCGDIHDVRRHEYDRSRFCSRSCRANYTRVFRSGKNSPKYNRVKNVCQQCGKEYEVVPSGKDRKKFCSKGCYNEWKKENSGGSNNPSWNGGKVTVFCGYCGKEYEVTPSKKPSARFCSRDCYSKWMSECQIGEDHPLYKQRIVRVCRQCGMEYSVIPSVADITSFCSVECMGKWASANKVGDKASNWKGGLTTWRDHLKHSSVYKSWRMAVFERDDYTCQKCMVRGGRLQAHHIRPVRSNKNNLLLFDVNNGITLCEECHREVNGHEEEFESLFDTMIQEKGGD